MALTCMTGVLTEKRSNLGGSFGDDSIYLVIYLFFCPFKVHAFSLRKLDRVKPRSVDITTTTAPKNAKSSITEVAWET